MEWGIALRKARYTYMMPLDVDVFKHRECACFPINRSGTLSVPVALVHTATVIWCLLCFPPPITVLLKIDQVRVKS